MKKAFLLGIILFSLPFTAQAQIKPQIFECQRFQSKCTGEGCYQLLDGFKKDVTKKILTVRKTETVDYVIDEAGGVETLRGEQAVPSRDRQLVMNYKFVGNEYGKIALFNKDKKGAVNIKVEIEPTTGFYYNFLIHTDGSIKEVPLGEPYLAYFGWCTGDTISQPSPADVATPPEPATAPAKP